MKKELCLAFWHGCIDLGTVEYQERTFENVKNIISNFIVQYRFLCVEGFLDYLWTVNYVCQNFK